MFPDVCLEGPAWGHNCADGWTQRCCQHWRAMRRATPAACARSWVAVGPDSPHARGLPGSRGLLSSRRGGNSALPQGRLRTRPKISACLGPTVLANGSRAIEFITIPNNYLSGVYYLRTHPGADTINFHDPRSQTGIIRPPVVGPHGREYRPGGFEECRMGRCSSFPAYVPHSVDANASVEERVSISFNVHVLRFCTESQASHCGAITPPSQHRSGRENCVYGVARKPRFTQSMTQPSNPEARCLRPQQERQHEHQEPLRSVVTCRDHTHPRSLSDRACSPRGLTHDPVARGGCVFLVSVKLILLGYKNHRVQRLHTAKAGRDLFGSAEPGDRQVGAASGMRQSGGAQMTARNAVIF